MSFNAELMCGRSVELFSQRQNLLSLWQDVADNFYPERADFTSIRPEGSDFASHLMTSSPLLQRRKLTDIIGYMLRADQWFGITTTKADLLDDGSKQWLESATKIQYDAMYDKVANFSRATKEGDADYTTFGQNVMSIDELASGGALSYKTHHLRDCAWTEGDENTVDEVHVRYKYSAIELNKLFKGNVSRDVKRHLERNKNPYAKISCLHLVMPWESYSPDEPNPFPRMKYVSIHMEMETKHVLEFKQVRRNRYNVARWATLGGSQYAHSPAVMAALPDARMLQSMNLVILSAGEKAVDPPMIGLADALRGDINLFPGGFTAVEHAHARQLREVLQPIQVDKSGLPMGFQLMESVKLGMAELFYLNELRLPSLAPGDKTAYEVSQLVREAAQAAMPILEPIEADYNGGVCDKTFGTLMDGGFFGSPRDIPRQLLSSTVDFKFKSPYRDALTKAEADKLMEAVQIIGAGAEIDEDVDVNLDAQMAVRDAMKSTGVPEKWIKDEKVVIRDLEARRQARAQAMQMQQAQEVAATGAAMMQGEQEMGGAA